MMKSLIGRWVIAALAMMLAMTTVHAGGQSPDHEAILEQQREIRRGIEADEPAYGHLNEFHRRRLMSAQDRVFWLLEDSGRLRTLSVDEQLELFNQLKKIEALLTKQDKQDHTVCERVRIAGTRRYQMACMTQAERERRADSARSEMMQRAGCTTAACKGGDP